MSNLICEINEDVGIVTEAATDGNGKNYFIEGVFMQSEIVNKNKRFYRKNILEREVNKYNENYIIPKRAVGELSHPDSTQINMERVSHVIKSLVPEGNDFIGKAKIMDTPYGKIVKNFIDEGVKFGVSSRGYGSMKINKGITEVMDDFKLITPADIVADPSAPRAFVSAVLENDQSWMKALEQVFESEDLYDLRNELRSMSRKQIEENALIKFEQFLQSIHVNK